MDKDTTKTHPPEVHPILLEHFGIEVGEPSRIQLESWDAIGKGEDVVVISPTGSGKTWAALMVPLDDIVSGRTDRDACSVLYVTPMKALGADVLQNLRRLSDAIGPLPSPEDGIVLKGRRKEGAPLKVAFRSGDVPQKERRRMLLAPPDILIATPENLLLMMCSSYRSILKKVRYVIVDELHEMMRSKRGAMLSLTLEHLEGQVMDSTGSRPARIGLSATVRGAEATRFLGGYDGSGRRRPVRIVLSGEPKELHVSIRTLMGEEMTDEDLEDVLDRDIIEMLDSFQGSMVVFRNTRARTEEMAYRLTSKGRDDVAPHHGSMGIELRSLAESGLKGGALRCIVSSTTLELGIDVGKIDMAVQIGSPKDPSRLVQRIGRSGHRMGGVSHGVLYPLSVPDLIDGHSVARAVLGAGTDIERRSRMPFDVLAQFIVGAALRTEGTSRSTVLALARRTSAFHGLKAGDLDRIIDMLTLRLEGKGSPLPRLWSRNGVLTPRKNTRQAFYLNCGTISREVNYRVVDEVSRRIIGDLSRDFGEALYEGDVILLGSKSCRISGFTGNTIRVREAKGSVPTVPRWTGEMPSRGPSTAARVYDFWERGPPTSSRVRSKGTMLEIDQKAIRILGAVHDEATSGGWRPTRDNIPIEVMQRRGRTIMVFHLPAGRGVTDPLSRLLSHRVRSLIGARIDFISNDDGFAISSPAPLSVEDVRTLLTIDDVRSEIRGIVLSGSAFRNRFSQCAARSLLVLSRFGGRETGIRYKRNTIGSLVGNLRMAGGGIFEERGAKAGLALIAEEALREAMEDHMDLERTEGLVRSISDGSMGLTMVMSTDGPGTIGRSIISAWERNDGVEDGPSNGRMSRADLLRSGERDAEILKVQGTHPGLGADIGSFLSGKGIGVDPATAISALGMKEPLALERLIDEGVLFPIHLAAGTRYFLTDPQLDGADVPRATEVRAWRLRMLREHPGMGSLSDSVPFFTDPIEAMGRVRHLDFDDIRSALIGGRLAPFVVGGVVRIGDPRWALTWNALTWKDPGGGSNLRGGKSSERAGDAPVPLPPGFRTMIKDPRILILDPLDRHPEGDRTFESGRRLIDLLDVLGPVRYEDLCELFSWPGGYVHPGLSRMISEGRIGALAGSLPDDEGPGSLGGPALWLWSKGWLKKVCERPSSKGPPGGAFRRWVTSSDPFIVLYRNSSPRNEKGHVRGARDINLSYLVDGRIAGHSFLTLSGDMVRVHDLEVADYTMLDEASADLLDVLDAATRMGYSNAAIEAIMGIPSPSAASRSVDVLLEGGFGPCALEDRTILARGPLAMTGLSREDIVLIMLAHQGLLPGHHLSHPLEVINRIGGVADRWEVLSRIGRYRHPAMDGSSVLARRMAAAERIMALESSVLDPGFKVGPTPETVYAGRLEGLPELRDMVRQFGLHRGILDQPCPVFSFTELFPMFPPEESTSMSSLGKDEKTVLSMVRSRSGKGTTHPRLSDHVDVSEAIMRKGMITFDGWGKPHHIIRGVRSRRGKGGSMRDPPPRGVTLRAWLLNSAMCLGSFTFRDLMAYSPNIASEGRVRMMLSELCGSHLTKGLMRDRSPEIVYSLKDPVIDMSGDIREHGQGRISVLSPRDRMARVLSSDVSKALSRSNGYVFLSGGLPLASVRMRRASASTRRHGLQGSWTGRLVMTSASIDRAARRQGVLRSVRRRMFELGFDVRTVEEMDSETDLYSGLD